MARNFLKVPQKTLSKNLHICRLCVIKKIFVPLQKYKNKVQFDLKITTKKL